MSDGCLGYWLQLSINALIVQISAYRILAYWKVSNILLSVVVEVWVPGDGICALWMIRDEKRAKILATC